MNELHIPTITGTQVITFNPNSMAVDVPLVYAVTLTQTGTGVPIVDTEISNTIGVVPTYTRASTGKYQLTDANASFTIADTIVINGGNETNGYVSNAFRVNDSIVAIESFDHSNHTVDYEDDVLKTFNLVVQKYNQSSGGGGGTFEEQFNSIIAQMDSVQLDIWLKIVIRTGGSIGEVSGSKYRKTGNLITSTRPINS